MAQSQPPPKKFTSHAERARQIWCFAVIHAGIVTPGLREGQGSRANLHAPFTFVLLLIYATYIPVVAYYIPIWLGLVFYAWLRADPAENSRFEGVQWPFRRYLDDRIARVVEVIVLLCVGLIVQTFASDLGSMIASTAMSSAIALAMRMEMIRAIRREEADARAEMAFRARISKGANW